MANCLAMVGNCLPDIFLSCTSFELKKERTCNAQVVRQKHSLEGLFRANTCSDCGGDYMLIEDNAAWRERHPDYEFAKNIHFEAINVVDTKEAMLCPATQTIMRKFKISATNSHRLDYSSAVGGLWLGKGEWELLVQGGQVVYMHSSPMFGRVTFGSPVPNTVLPIFTIISLVTKFMPK